MGAMPPPPVRATPVAPNSHTAVLAPATLRRVLIVKLSALGDVVHALPLAGALRDALGPSVFLGWAVKKRLADLLHGNPHLDAVYEAQGSRARDLLVLGKTLRGEKFDTVLDAQGLFVSGLVARMTGAPRRVGFDLNRENNAFFLTHAVVPATQRAHMVDKLLGFCNALGIARPAGPPPSQTYLAHAAIGQADTLLGQGRDDPRVGLIVGASTAEKTWPAARWSELVRLLAARGAHPVLLGGKSEMETARGIEREANGAVAANLAGQTPSLQTLASVLARCDVVVGGDSGPTHLAVAVGAPVVGLYGVTDPERTGPQWGAAPTRVLDFAQKEAPPALRRPRHPTLPDALARIPALSVADAVFELLQ